MAPKKSRRRLGPPTAARKVLGTMIREARRRKSLSQEMAAHRLGKEHSYLSRIEAAQQTIDITALYDLLEAIEVDFRQFMREFEERCQAASPPDSI